MEPLNLERIHEFETLRVQAKDFPCLNIACSRDEKTVMKLMESSRNRLENRNTISLPWKRDKALLPNNYPLAERRLFSVESNLLKDKSKTKMHDEAITNTEKKNGWAWALSEREVQAIARLVYYLPHNGIYRPEKKRSVLHWEGYLIQRAGSKVFPSTHSYTKVHASLEICLGSYFAFCKS